MKSPHKMMPRGVACLVCVVALFAYIGSVMGAANMLNTLMRTAHDLLLNTVFYLMAVCVLTGALGQLFSVFGVVNLIQSILRFVMRPLYNLPGVAVLGCVMTFISDNPAIMTLTSNRRFASYFKKYQYISLANFGTAFGMGLILIVFMIGKGFFIEPLIGLVGAVVGGIVATRLMQYLVCRIHPEFRTEDVVDAQESEALRLAEEQEAEKPTDSNTFVRVLNAVLEGGRKGVDIGIAIIPGVLVICTMVMMFTFGPSAETGQYTGEAYQGCALLPLLAGKVSFLFEWLFGFSAPELVAFPITALGAVGAALSLVPKFMEHGILDGNAVAVFTAMGMCWSGFLSTHTSILDSMGYRHLLTRDFLCQILGGICAGITAHLLYVCVIA